MNPYLLLSLWRKRWGLKAPADKERPYLRGRPNAWGEKLALAHAWTIPCATGLAVGGCLLVAAWLVTLRFSPGAQLTFSLALTLVALYVRRYQGRLITLVLFGMSALASLRYLYWRFTETLNPSTNLDFAWGLGLGMAELHICSLLALNCVCTIWPLRRSSDSLPADHLQWPSIDIYLIVQAGESEAAATQRCEQALALDWPAESKRITLLDGDPAMPWRTLAESMGFGYSPSLDTNGDLTELIDCTMRKTQGALVAVFDGTMPADRGFLRQTAGWFVRDHTLALVQTPVNPLDAPPSEALGQRLGLWYQGGGLLLQRTLILEVGGLAANQPLQHTLPTKGLGHAYIGAENNGDVHRIDSPSCRSGLRWRQYSATLLRILQLYRPLSTWFFLATPLVFIFAGIDPIQTQVAALALYGLPHWLHGHLVRDRLSHRNRLSLGEEIGDTLKAVYLLLPTTLSWLRTRLKRLTMAGQPDQVTSVTSWKSISLRVACCISWAGVLVGSLQVGRSPTPASAQALGYLLWCAANGLLLTSALAVDAERRTVIWKQKALARLPAMLQLATGHTVACVTQNFPETILSIKMPAPAQVQSGDAIRVTLFLERREFDFPGRVHGVAGQEALIEIDRHALARYAEARAIMFTRDQNWPRWLPGPHADQPLPEWLVRPVLGVFADLTLQIGQQGLLTTLKRLGLQILQRKPT
jgi:cellulose synthase (UDP-forming)